MRSAKPPLTAATGIKVDGWGTKTCTASEEVLRLWSRAADLILKILGGFGIGSWKSLMHHQPVDTFGVLLHTRSFLDTVSATWRDFGDRRVVIHSGASMTNVFQHARQPTPFEAAVYVSCFGEVSSSTNLRPCTR